jgi:hypothetical protein
MVGHVGKMKYVKMHTKFNYSKGKGKAHPKTGHEGPERE